MFGTDLLVELERLYRSRLGDFRRFARAVLGGDSEQAWDAVQDGFVRAVRDQSQFRRDGSLEAWVWACVANAAKDALRRQRREPRPTAYADEAGDEPSAPNDELRRLVASLPERQRLILFLRYFADLDHQTIATMLEIAPGTVAASLHAARRALRQAIQEVPE